jgi:hypothetical protein
MARSQTSTERFTCKIRAVSKISFVGRSDSKKLPRKITGGSDKRPAKAKAAMPRSSQCRLKEHADGCADSGEISIVFSLSFKSL